MITKQKVNNYEVKAIEKPPKPFFGGIGVLLFYSMACYVFLIVTNVLISYFFGFNLATNYISDLGSRRVIPFPYFHDIICVFGGLISLPANFFVRKKLRIRYKDSKHSLLFVELGVALGLVGNVGYVLLGVFSLDRAGPGQIFHGIIALLSFTGYITSIFFFSLNIVLSHKCRLKNLGAFGLVIPIFLSVLYLAISIPLVEWALLSSIVLFMLILDYYVFKK